MKIEDLIKATDRRKKSRFPIHRELRYKLLSDSLLSDSGVGQSLNISSGGIAFTVDHALQPDAFIELSISWPVLLDDTCPLRLIVFGRVLRSTDRKAVCVIDKHEFRTQARVFQAAGILRQDSMLQRWAGEMLRESPKPRVASV